MGRLSGIVLVLAGMVVGAYALSWPQATAVGTAVREPADTDKKAQTAAVVVEPVTAPGKAPAPTVAPQTVAVAPPPAPMLTPPAADAVQAKAPAPPAVTNPPPPAPPAAAKAITPPSVEPPVAKAPLQPPASKPAAVVGLPLDRTALTKELQRHLTRVGCYEGDINGVWTPAVRRSMKAFTDRVNATLPIEQPDYILLAMVQNHQDKACGRTCAPGQGLADDGRCFPNAIIARAAKKQAPAAQPGLVAKAVPPPADKKATSENRPTTTAAPGTPAPLAPMVPPRMALAGPKQEPPLAPAKSGPPLAPSQLAQAKRDLRYPRSVWRPTYAERRNRQRRRVAGWSSRFAYPSWAQPRSMP